jgi:hypothetical protein
LTPPGQAAAAAEKLKQIIFPGIKAQMKWKPSCKAEPYT